MTSKDESLISAAIDDAEDICDTTAGVSATKPRLLIDNCNPDLTVSDLRDILCGSGRLYDRGVPVRLVLDQLQKGAVAQTMTPDGLVLMGHQVCRPYRLHQKEDGPVTEKDARLPRPIATMYLVWRGEWQLAPLNGITSTPLLRDDGTIYSANGYDAESGMWLENVPDVTGIVPAWPSKDDAAAALLLIRETFKTFCFADAETVNVADCDVPVVDTSKPPGRDESAFLVSLKTAVCRASLDLAPGVLLRAAPMSGAGAGKGLLARCLCMVAYGREPHAVTGGGTAEELEKRIGAELMEGGPALFLDNLNNMAVKSDLLASAITERPARVRVLGKSQMVPINASAIVILTGNGLTVSEDLARRFVEVNLDPGTEDPETRSFKTDIRAEISQRRLELLAALLTIWRWGRLNTEIHPGLTLGSFEQWGRWVRDPLVALGCQDPAQRVAEAKERDGRRRVIAELFETWWEMHGDRPVKVCDLCDEVKQLADPQERGRQYLASYLEKRVSLRIAGFILTRQGSVGKWGAATYALERTGEQERHRVHRGDSAESAPLNGTDAPRADANCAGNGREGEDVNAPMPPMPPMRSEPTAPADEQINSARAWRMRL